MENNNSALTVLRILRKAADENGRVEIDVSEICRAAALSNDEVRENLDDLSNEGFLKLELACVLHEHWR